MWRKSLLNIGLLVTLVGCAAAPSTPTSTTMAHSVTAQGPACVSTGSRVPPTSPGQQCGVSGRTYSGDDLQRTGEEQVGDALQKLDPSITVHH